MSGGSGARPLALDGFTSAYGRPPDVVWFAPGRLNVIGEFTDYNGGIALPFALAEGVSAAGASRDDRQLWAESAQVPGAPRRIDAGPVSDDWARFVAGAMAVLTGRAGGGPGADVYVDGNVPLGAGLSSSAALACSTVAVVAEVLGIPLAPEEVVDAAWRVEHDYLGVPCGRLDQTASVHGQPRAAMVFDAVGTVEQVAVDPDQLGAEFFVAPLRGRHDLADGSYAEKRRQCEEAARLLRVSFLAAIRPDELPDALQRVGQAFSGVVRHVVTENRRVQQAAAMLRDGGEAPALGMLLTSSHESLRDDFEVTTPEADATVLALVAGGAFGARMVGGGLGGSVVALVPQGHSPAVNGFVARPSAGLHRQISA